MKSNWFRTMGWIYIPVSLAGYVITLTVLAFCVNCFVAIDRHSHSASDTLYGFFPYLVSALTVLFWIASRTSRANSADESQTHKA